MRPVWKVACGRPLPVRHRMQRAFATATLALLCGVFGSAQASPGGAADPVTSSSAAQMAAAIDRHYNHLHSLEVGFTQTYDGMGMHRVERGTLLLAKGGRLHAGKMRWTYTQPAGKLFVFDGSFAYFYTPGQSEVERVPARQMDDLRSPLALLLGHADLAKQLTGATLTPGPDGKATLRGVPKGLEQRVASLSVTANAAGVIDRMTIEQTDGARNSFLFVDEQPNVPAPASDFAFVPPAGTHVVEGEAPI